MGNDKTYNGFGREPSSNGVDNLYGSSHYSNYVITRRPSKAKKRIITYCLDLTALSVMISFLLGIFGKIQDIPHALTWFVVLIYLIARAVLIWSKLFAFLGKNWIWIKKGMSNLKSKWNEK